MPSPASASRAEVSWVLRSFAFVVMLAALVVACSNATPPSLAIVPDGGPIVAGQTVQLVATRHYSDGTIENVTRIVDWSTSNTNVLRLVSPEVSPGLVTAVNSATSVFITARDPDSNEYVISTFSVTASQLEKIALNPSPALSLTGGESHSLTAIGTYTDGTTADITNNVLWSSSNEAVATVSNVESSRGTVNALTEGNTSITAEDSATGLVGSTLVFVSTQPPAATLKAIALSPNPESVNVGESTQYSAVGIYSDGTSEVLTPDRASWTSSNPTIATVSSSGLATGVALGDVSITVAANGTAIRGSALLTVGH